MPNNNMDYGQRLAKLLNMYVSGAILNDAQLNYICLQQFHNFISNERNLQLEEVERVLDNLISSFMIEFSNRPINKRKNAFDEIYSLKLDIKDKLKEMRS